MLNNLVELLDKIFTNFKDNIIMLNLLHPLYGNFIPSENIVKEREREKCIDEYETEMFLEEIRERQKYKDKYEFEMILKEIRERQRRWKEVITRLEEEADELEKSMGITLKKHVNYSVEGLKNLVKQLKEIKERKKYKEEQDNKERQRQRKEAITWLEGEAAELERRGITLKDHVNYSVESLKKIIQWIKEGWRKEALYWLSCESDTEEIDFKYYTDEELFNHIEFLVKDIKQSDAEEDRRRLEYEKIE
jgi:hypothetical protein